MKIFIKKNENQKKFPLPQLNSEIVALENSLNESEISNFLYKKNGKWLQSWSRWIYLRIV